MTGDARVRVFFEGTFSSPRLDHPECVAVHPDGSVWCGGEAGQIYRIDAAGEQIEQVATTGGFILGVTFDPQAATLYACDIAHRAVFRIPLRTCVPDVFADGADGIRFRNPNFAVFGSEGQLFVSDSYPAAEPGPPVFQFGPDGSGRIWYGQPMSFANGLAYRAASGQQAAALYVAESFLPGVTRIDVRPDGSAGQRDVVATLPGTVPDGLAFGPDGRLYVGCYEPSQILRLEPDGTVTTVAHDPTAHLLCHPTNLAFRGSTAMVANLGRWHVAAVEV